MPIPRSALRLTPDEIDELLAGAREAHVATASDGRPHVAPMWYVWLDGALWVNSLIRSRRAHDVAAGSRVAVCVDAGHDYAELRGAVLEGSFVPGEADLALPRARAAFADKYWGGNEMPPTRSHEWLKLVPDRVVSWDFRKIPAGRDPRLRGGGGDLRP